MPDLLLAFITGLTTGGLSCLAVQGGLLASSLAQQIEKEYQSRPVKKGGRAASPATALPIALFLLAKLAAYTLLGLLLGLLGSVLTLTPMLRAGLLIFIGVFMIGNALRMFNVHPIFRYFIIEPPSTVTRYIRRVAKNGDSYITPLFLGALTVLIPCGVTQAMMAVAMTTGSPMQGAATMFAFTLGTSPVFFAVAYLATQLGARLEKFFMRLVAVVVLILGLVSIDSGLTLAGSPFSLSALLSPVAASQPLSAPTAEASTELVLNAQNNGYVPDVLYAKADQEISLKLVTKNTTSCARAFVIPTLNVEELLPKTGEVEVKIPPQKPGAVIHFSCSMGMYSGRIVFAQ